ncbi:MAG TPA: hypothetical protein VIO58_03650 [Candidatus Methanoperedens sp.]
MNTSPEEEQDLKLKLRLMRYFWHNGYLVRKNVSIVESLDKHQYTDIDVLAIKIDEELNTNYLVCDCKSGMRAKTHERLFWLSGIMKYFNANQGIFLRTKLFGVKYMELAKRLDITPLSEEQLYELEKAYKIDINKSLGAFSNEPTPIDQVFLSLRKLGGNVEEYINTSYWNDVPSVQINNLVACCKRINELDGLMEKARNFLLAYTFSHLSLSALQFSKTLLTIPNSNKEEYAKIELLGGKLAHEERKRLLKGFYEFMAKEIKERYKAKYPISSNQFVESFVPDYSKYFVEFAIRTCENPKYSFLIPRFFDLLAFQTVIGNRDIEIKDLLPIPLNEDIATLIKPVKDFETFATRSGLLPTELNELINKQLTNLELNSKHSEK